DEGREEQSPSLLPDAARAEREKKAVEEDRAHRVERELAARREEGRQCRQNQGQEQERRREGGVRDSSAGRERIAAAAKTEGGERGRGDGNQGDEPLGRIEGVVRAGVHREARRRDPENEGNGRDRGPGVSRRRPRDRRGGFASGLALPSLFRHPSPLEQVPQ